MSSIIRKIDEAVHPERKTGPTGSQYTTSTTGTTGVHHGGVTNTHHHTQAGSHTHGHTVGAPGATTGTHDAYASNLPGPAHNTAGPHTNDMMNKLDPRVDSDMSNPQTRAAHEAQTGGPGPASKTAGPHKSNLLNKLDPTVDSDMSKSRGTGAMAGTEGLRTYGHGGVESAGPRLAGPGAGVTGTYGEGHVGTGHHAAPHMGGTANTTSRHTGGYTGVGTGGGQAPEGTYGPHGSRVANAVDPRVDSDRDNRAHHTVGGGKYV